MSRGGSTYFSPLPTEGDPSRSFAPASPGAKLDPVDTRRKVGLDQRSDAELAVE
jgi:hypothetical protein